MGLNGTRRAGPYAQIQRKRPRLDLPGGTLNVRFGSKAEVFAGSKEVRFVPKADI